MKIKHGLLLSILTVLPIASPSASEFTVTGMINEPTCVIDDNSSGNIVLGRAMVGSLQTGGSAVQDWSTYLDITVSCEDPNVYSTVEGRFTTQGEVDPATRALKNLITDASGAKDVGIQIVDVVGNTVIDPTSEDASVTLTMAQGKATFNFGLAYANLGVAGVGDVRVEATFIATYL